MYRRLPDTVWEEISRHWRSGSMSLAALARRYDIHVSTITKHARRHGWPPRDRPRNEPAVTAETLLADLTIELRHSLARLRSAPEAQTPEQARERTRLIRETHRALALRVKIEHHGAPPPTPPDAPTPLDLGAARREFLARLKRLDRQPPEQKAPDAPTKPVAPSAQPDARPA